jgi:heat shock protein HtpX
VGWGLLNFGSYGAWPGGIERHAILGSEFLGSELCVSLALMPAASQLQPVRVTRSGEIISVELRLATDWPGCMLYCRIDGGSQQLAGLRRQVHRDENHRHSAWIIAAMVLLLALCGWIAGGADGARRAIAEAAPRKDTAAVPHAAMLRWLGARFLRFAEVPDLFRILAELCRRAKLFRLPDLYYMAAPDQMNAYAYGGPEGAAIVLTGGLLQNMSRGEITGILAHEVAHICNRDAWAMDWASALDRAIERNALAALALPHIRAERTGARHQTSVLRAAPAISRLLLLALSRVRELDADATALELTGDTDAMVGALAKLERHHTGAAMPAAAAFDDSVARFLRSHPGTSERVGTLLNLAH